MTPAKRPPSFLEEPHPRLLLFGGKGGVGKTSLAAATALALAHRFPEKHVLVVSTDPAHSLADSFECPVGPAPRSIYDRPNLFGLEIDAAALLEAFLGRHGDLLRRIIMRGTYLAEDEISRFLDLQFPGLDEVMALLQISAFLAEGGYDTVVVDTAPTGHTLRLLALPTLVETWIKLFDTLLEKHRYLSQLYTHRYRAGEAEVFLNRLTHDIRGVRRLLQDREQSLFIPVTIPEEMAMAETRKLVAWLTAAKIPVRHLVINRVMPPSQGCPFCLAKWETQRRHLDGLGEMFPTLSLIAVPLFPREVKGEGPLKTLAAALLQPSLLQPQIDADTRRYRRASASICGSAPVRLSRPGPGVKLLLFGGKGGVGKTALACAFALQLASLAPEQRVLLFSTDPAHSLSDCLEQRVGAQVTAVEGRGNLFALEIHPEERFRRFTQVYAEEITELFEDVTQDAHLDVCFDRDVMRNLLDLTPPGLDEIMALLELMDYMRADAYDVYILDNAPTGHLLRFLELPDLMLAWLRTFFEVILTYRAIGQLPRTSALLVQISKDLKEIRRQLSDPQRCEFIPVAIPTMLAFKETARLLAALDRLNVRCRRLLVNQVITSSDGCAQCAALQAEQEQVIATCQRAFATLEVVSLPCLFWELKGAAALSGFLRFDATVPR